MHERINISGLRNLVGPAHLKGGYLGGFLIHGPRLFHDKNKKGINHNGVLRNRVGAAPLDG